MDATRLPSTDVEVFLWLTRRGRIGLDSPLNVLRTLYFSTVNSQVETIMGGSKRRCYMRYLVALFFSLAILGTSVEARAAIRGHDREEVRDMLYSSCYLRIQVPTNTAVQPFLEISPTGFSWDRLVGVAEQKAKEKNKWSGVYFAFQPNDLVRWGKLDYNKDTISVWFQGKRDELKVIFIQIETLDDFKKAFDHVFSRVPLQDEHPDWPAEIRLAIAQRKVIQGMTKQQAACVIGVPLKVETVPEGGMVMEVWYPLQDTQDHRSPKTGLPAVVKFAGGKVQAIE